MPFISTLAGEEVDFSVVEPSALGSFDNNTNSLYVYSGTELRAMLAGTQPGLLL